MKSEGYVEIGYLWGISALAIPCCRFHEGSESLMMMIVFMDYKCLCLWGTWTTVITSTTYSYWYRCFHDSWVPLIVILPQRCWGAVLTGTGIPECIRHPSSIWHGWAPHGKACGCTPQSGTLPAPWWHHGYCKGPRGDGLCSEVGPDVLNCSPLNDWMNAWKSPS